MTIKESLQFEKNLYNLINTCGLPVDTAFYILKSVYLDFEKTVYDCAQQEPENPVTSEQKVYTVENMPKQVEVEMEEMENEQSSANASEHSGSTNNN